MGYCLSSITYLLLIVGIFSQVVSLLTSHMYEDDIENKTIGLFIKCTKGTCSWFRFEDFSTLQLFEKIVIGITLFSSLGVVVLFTLFSLITIIPRFKSRGLHVFVGAMLIFNAVLIAGVVTVYTTSNSERIRFAGGPIRYGWSYWLLYATIGTNFFAALCYCFNNPSKQDDYDLEN